jgi:flagellar motor switch protein FliN/FliY
MADNEVATSGTKTPTPAATPASTAAPASFPPLDGGGAVPAPKNIEFILDIPMQVTVQVGSAKMVIRELLQLGQGSVIELEKLAGEPMEVLVNNKLVARGEVVVVNEKFGIRLTDVISAAERVQQLA